MNILQNLFIAVVIFACFPMQMNAKTSFLTRMLRGHAPRTVMTFTVGIDEESLREMAIAELGESCTEQTVKMNVKEKMGAAIDESIAKVLQRRIDGLDVDDAVVQTVGDHRFLVKLTGVIDDATRSDAKRNLEKTGKLEFRLVHPRNQELVDKLISSGDLPEGYVCCNAANAFIRKEDRRNVCKTSGRNERLGTFGNPPWGYQFMLKKEGYDGIFTPVFVSRKVELTGEYLVSASIVRDPLGCPLIEFELNSKGGELMRKLSRCHMAYGEKNPTGSGRQLAIILDGEIISVPVLIGEIGERAQISGCFGMAELRSLVNILNAGALPVPLKILSEERFQL